MIQLLSTTCITLTNKLMLNNPLHILPTRDLPIRYALCNNRLFNFRFAHLKAGSEALSETSSVASSLLSSYDEPSTMRRRVNNKLCSGFVAKKHSSSWNWEESIWFDRRRRATNQSNSKRRSNIGWWYMEQNRKVRMMIP